MTDRPFTPEQIAEMVIAGDANYQGYLKPHIKRILRMHNDGLDLKQIAYRLSLMFPRIEWEYGRQVDKGPIDSQSIRYVLERCGAFGPLATRFCPTCYGSGEKKCSPCKGTGERSYGACRQCNGRGILFCLTCNGTGELRGEPRLDTAEFNRKKREDYLLHPSSSPGEGGPPKDFEVSGRQHYDRTGQAPSSLWDVGQDEEMRDWIAGLREFSNRSNDE